MGKVDLVAVIKSPKEAYQTLAEKGGLTAQDSSVKVFFQSFYAGCYIGFGALLAVVISGNMPEWTQANPGFESFVFAALFPVNLLLILLSGGILFTGTSAAMPAAIYEGKTDVKNTLRCLGLSWMGNVLGSLLFAYFTDACGLLEGPALATTLKIAKKKVSKDFITTFLKGIGCNWMVCMAVFLQGMAQDMCGKYLGIWFPISTFVMIGFEHIPANFYLLALALVGGSAESVDVTFADVFVKNWIPVTLGNFVAGAFIVAGGYSYAFGKLGEKLEPSLQEAAKLNPMNDVRRASRHMGDIETGVQRRPSIEVQVPKNTKIEQPATPPSKLPSVPSEFNDTEGKVLSKKEGDQGGLKQENEAQRLTIAGLEERLKQLEAVLGPRNSNETATL